MTYNGYTAAEVRAWAKSNNVSVEARGKIPGYVIRTFVQAHPNQKSGTTPAGIAPPQPRKVMGRKATGKTETVKKPPCPVHRVAMVYYPEFGHWRCPEEGCKLRAFPEEGSTRPITGKGKITLIRESTQGRKKDLYWLRSDNGVLMDITNVIGSYPDIEFSGGTPVATIELILNME